MFFTIGLDHISVRLPPAQPMASIDAEVAKRCFIVCGPPVPPIYAMKDAFCRFGNLIDVYMLPGKNCGYAKYASVESANEAIEVRSSLFFLQLLLLHLSPKILYLYSIHWRILGGGFRVKIFSFELKEIIVIRFVKIF